MTTKEQQLMQRVQARRKKRAHDLTKTQWYADRQRAIADAPRRTAMDFWCVECGRDFSCADAVKLTSTHQGVPRAYYEGMCPERHTAIRYVTDKHADPYYHQSAVLRAQRAQMADDMLTPADPRFRIVYPKQWAQLEAEREQAELAAELENQQLYG